VAPFEKGKHLNLKKWPSLVQIVFTSSISAFFFLQSFLDIFNLRLSLPSQKLIFLFPSPGSFHLDNLIVSYKQIPKYDTLIITEMQIFSVSKKWSVDFTVLLVHFIDDTLKSQSVTHLSIVSQKKKKGGQLWNVWGLYNT
jgi:hypothetical protein